MDIKIRSANSQDCEIIKDLITQLAIYEKALEQVQTTEYQLNKVLFEDNYAKCFLCFLEEKAVGMAFYYIQYDLISGNEIIYLEDLFVLPEYRNKGIGKILLQQIAKEALKIGANRIKWTVLDWNLSAHQFYKKIKGQFIYELDYMRYNNNNQ